MIPLVDSMEPLPPREGIYAQGILPSAPVLPHGTSAPYQVVLPIAEAELRLFCVMEWEDLPDSEMLNFLELLGNLAARAIAINNLRMKNTQANSQVSSGEFTILSLSSALEILSNEKDPDRFLSLAADVFLELGQMSECLLSLWDDELKGYALTEYRSGGIRSHSLLPAPQRYVLSRIPQPFLDLKQTSPDTIFTSWGLDACPCKELEPMHYLIPLCSGNQIEGFVALAAKIPTPLSEPQKAALRIAAQFMNYELHRFKAVK